MPVILKIYSLENCKMGEWYKKIYIKNIGMLVAFATFFWGMWYTARDLLVIDGDVGVLLRILGVICVTFLAYLPYRSFYHKISLVPYPSFMIVCFGILLIGDILIRIFVMIWLSEVNGFFFIIFYPMIMIMIWWCVFLGAHVVRYILIERKYFCQLCSEMKKIFMTLMNRRGV